MGPRRSGRRVLGGGVEYWLARDLQVLLGYAKWDNFLAVIAKAKTACEVSEHSVRDHFADVGKMVDLGSGSHREIDDVMLTRYACYLIAQNGDPRKQEVAFAQTYFAVQPARRRFWRAALSLARKSPGPGLPSRVRSLIFFRVLARVLLVVLWYRGTSCGTK